MKAVLGSARRSVESGVCFGGEDLNQNMFFLHTVLHLQKD